jgi:hypothetical protein
MKIIIQCAPNTRGFPSVEISSYMQGSEKKLQITIGKETTYVLLSEILVAMMAFKDA